MSTALKNRIRERIAELEADRDKEIEEVKTAFGLPIDELRALLDEDSDEGNDDEPAPRPRRKPARQPAAEPAANGNGKPPGKQRTRIRELLLTDAPLDTSAIADRLKVSPMTVTTACKGYPWFEKVDPSNRLSPWQLTEAGRLGAD